MLRQGSKQDLAPSLQVGGKGGYRLFAIRGSGGVGRIKSDPQLGQPGLDQALR